MKPTPFLFLIALALLVVTGCKEDCSSTEASLEKAQLELQSKDSVMNAIGSAFRAIDSNMLEMRAVENEIVGQLGAKSRDKDAIRLNVDKMRMLMSMNENYVKQLETSLGASSANSKNLFAIISSMEEKVEMNNLRLAQLNHDLGNIGDDFKGMFEEYMNAEVERMMLQENLQQMEGNISSMEAKMDELKTHLNTAYFVKGTKRELIENGVLEKGGLLRSDKLNADNIDKTAFSSHDIRTFTSVNLGSAKVKLLTEHPTESYTLESGNLIIKDPKHFWSISKYLIVVTE